MESKNYHKYLYFTVLVLIGLLYWPRMSDFGLFTDGSIYGTIAHNMALGDGHFWSPIYHNFHHLQLKGSHVFYEHPPLMFWLESWFFRLFGDGFYVENIYQTVILVLHILTITFFFRALTQKRYSIFAAWPVLFLWYMVPTIMWSFAQNMIDNTLSLWVLWSVWAIFVGSRKDHFLYAVFAGFLMGMAVLTKGPLGFFPLVGFGLYWLASQVTQAKGFRYPFFRAFYKTVALIFGFSIVGLNVYMQPSGRAFFAQYIRQQVIPSVTGKREMSNTLAEHLSIIQDMLIQYSPIYVAAIILWLYFRKKSIGLARPKNHQRFAFWILVVGLSSSLPIALSAKSHSFYLISGIPYYALAVGVYWIEDLHLVVQNIRLTNGRQRIWKAVVLTVLVYSLIATVLDWGRYKRNHLLLKDIELLSQKIPTDTIVGLSPNTIGWAVLNSNLERHFLIQTNQNWEEEQVVLTRVATDSTYLAQLAQKKYEPLAGDWNTFLVFIKEKNVE